MILETLRCETRELHRQSERALDLQRATSSLCEYQALLTRLLGIYEPLESQLFSRPLPPGLEPGLRSKVPALKDDLQVLRSQTAAPLCDRLPTLVPGAAVWGAWYVVEGATLGGQVIAAQLARKLGVHRHNGAKFFDVYGEQRQQRWEQFCHLLSSLPDAEAGVVASGAVVVFSAMRDWLAERPSAPALRSI